MHIVCSQCNATYTIQDKKISSKNAVATCKKCGGHIAIEPGPISQMPDKLEIDKEYFPTPPVAEVLAQTRDTHPGTVLDEYPELDEYSPDQFSFGDILTLNKKGGFKSRKNNFKVKILGAVKELLERMLHENETVLRVATGTAYYPAEIFFGNGWFTMLYNRYAIIGTSQRLLMINVNYRMSRPAYYIFQILYSEIKKVGRGLFGTRLIFHRKNKGKRFVFSNLLRFFSCEMKSFLMDQVKASEKMAVADEPCDYICPACCTALPKGLTTCKACNVEFKSPGKAMLKSLILPGWGDIYLGHRLLGGFELFVSCMVWLLVFDFFLSGMLEDICAGLFILLAYHGIDSILTYCMAQKGYSLGKQFKQPAFEIKAQLAQNPT